MPPISLGLSDDQRFALMKLRRNVADLMRSDRDDQYLLRWLRARNYDPEAAEKMLRASLQWREQWGVDRIMTEWEVPEVLEKYFPSGICGYDKGGAPVIVVPFAGLDIWGLLHSATRSDFIRMTIRTLEHLLKVAQEQKQKYNSTMAEVIAIIDMDGFSIRPYAWRPAGEAIIALIQMYEANYPEILKACYIINAPKVFSLAFSIVKPFLNDYTLRKICIYKNDPMKWKKALLENIDPDQLPAYFGGTMTDPGGDTRCTLKVKPGGRVPKTYYFKKIEKNGDDPFFNSSTTVVKKGDKLCLKFLVLEEGSLLKWEFSSEGHDIKFGIMRRDEEGSETTTVPIHRVNCHLAAETGTLPCSGPATYTVVFDNTYSYLRSKKLHYSIEVKPPANGVLECDSL
ncbi:SEC14-like protein 2 [Hetaerina americana]|uniref:SEC14-like protein 2 n=1 Tax=Hetaerina americana TaxID=62018 RepID=UPI003A7F197F